MTGLTVYEQREEVCLRNTVDGKGAITIAKLSVKNEHRGKKSFDDGSENFVRSRETFSPIRRYVRLKR